MQNRAPPLPRCQLLPQGVCACSLSSPRHGSPSQQGSAETRGRPRRRSSRAPSATRSRGSASTLMRARPCTPRPGCGEAGRGWVVSAGLRKTTPYPHLAFEALCPERLDAPIAIKRHVRVDYHSGCDLSNALQPVCRGPQGGLKQPSRGIPSSRFHRQRWTTELLPHGIRKVAAEVVGANRGPRERGQRRRRRRQGAPRCSVSP